VIALAAVLYAARLGRAPIHIGADEARFAIQAHAVATTGRDLNGTRLPLFFHVTNPLVAGDNPPAWWQPTLFYLMAMVFRIAPVSIAAVRIPTVCLAVLNVLLIYLVARRLFANPWLAVFAALLLALTPAHFVLGRQAMDYFCPLTFALAWLWLLLASLQTDRASLPWMTGAVLGVGLYSYITSWMVMPAYLAMTLIVFHVGGKPGRWSAAVSIGFALALVPLAPWLFFHPSLPSETFRNYLVGHGARAAERLSLYWDYFNPSYLFFSGGSNPMWATRRAGVFLLVAAVLLPIGVRQLIAVKPSPVPRLVLLAFVMAPLPIVIGLPEDPRYFTPRDLLVVPFGVLICTAGIEWLLERGRGVGRVAAFACVAAALMQFTTFARDYFTDYQLRSAYRFDDVNFQAVMSAVVVADSAGHVPLVFLNDDLEESRVAQWKFHSLARGRDDIWQRTRYFKAAALNLQDLPAGSLLVLHANDPAVPLLTATDCSIDAIVNGVTDQPASVILRRR